MEWITPNKLIVCLYRSHIESAQRLTRLWNEGAILPPEIEAVRNEHLRYTYELGKKGITWAGGPFVDFSGGLKILSVNSISEAEIAINGDPYFVNSSHHTEEFHEWFIHMPLEKASPLHKGKLENSLKKFGIIPTKKIPEWTSPEKLFVCLCKSSSSHVQWSRKTWGAEVTLPAEIEAISNEHLRYAYELGERGITWAEGPFADFSGTLSIYAVNSLEVAKKAKQEDPFYKSGFLCNDMYFEWMIHGPLAKASPAHKESLIKSHLKAGIRI